jgi:hypothetical protein
MWFMPSINDAEQVGNDIANVVRHTRKLQSIFAKETTYLIIFAVFSASVILPVLENLFGVINPSPLLVIAVLVIHLILAAFAVRGTILFRELANLTDVNELEDVSNLLIGQNHEIKRLKSENIAINASLAFLRGFAIPARQYNLESDIQQLVSPLILEKERVLAFAPTAIYDFCLHLYDRGAGQLQVKWRVCHAELEANRWDRSWRPGQGHAGVAYANNNILITGDVSRNPAYTSPNADHRIRDNQYYRSCLSIAISGTDTEDPYGVLTITSNSIDQFNEDFRPLCEIYRLILSTYLTLYHSRVT